MQAIKLIDLQRQYAAYKEEIQAALKPVFETGFFIGGPALEHFERDLASYAAGTENAASLQAIGCSSGTDALLLALMASNIQAGDEVITSPYSFIATASVIPMLGAKPVFADVLAETYMLNPALIEAKITKKTKAIIAVSLFGAPAQFDELREIAKNHSLHLIEDAAQSFGAKYKGRISGSLGDISCTSFYPAKSLGAYGDAGAVFCRNNQQQAAHVRRLLNHGQEDRYYHNELGMNARLDSLQAALLSVKLRHYDDELAKRRSIALRYQNQLNTDSYRFQAISSHAQSVYSQFSLTVKTEMHREKVLARLQAEQIGYGMFYPIPLHLQRAFSSLGYAAGDFPVAEDLSKRMFSIPIHPFLRDDELKRVIEVLNSL